MVPLIVLQYLSKSSPLPMVLYVLSLWCVVRGFLDRRKHLLSLSALEKLVKLSVYSNMYAVTILCPCSFNLFI